MEKKYYEVVFEGHYNAIFGLLKGFLLGKNQNWKFYFSKHIGAKTETLADKIMDWAVLSNKVHHVVMEADFFNEFKKAITAFNKTKTRGEQSKFVHMKYIKSAKIIKKASFDFKAKTYGRPYGEEIKAMLKKLPAGVKLQNYKPKEEIHKSAKGVELYAPDHEYAFEASGTLSGSVMEIISLRKKLDDHPLVETGKITLSL